MQYQKKFLNVKEQNQCNIDNANIVTECPENVKKDNRLKKEIIQKKPNRNLFKKTTRKAWNLKTGKNKVGTKGWICEQIFRN